MTTHPDKTGDKGPERIFAASVPVAFGAIRCWFDEPGNNTEEIEYVRADLYDALQSANAELVKERDRYREALEEIRRGKMPEDYGRYDVCAARLSGIAREAISPTTNKADDGPDRSKPPCLECGATTAKESETMCMCTGNKYRCHGCELWP
jgi:hypothetical protein